MSPVIIESKIKRQGGTVIDFNTPDAPDGITRYHFKDDGFGNHVAPVENEDHIARFLSIREGFKLFSSGAATGAGLAQTTKAHTVPKVTAQSANTTPSQPTIEGQNAQTNEDAQGGDGDNAEGEAQEDANSEASEDDKARAEYERVFGVPARNNMKLETILAKIEAHRVATAQ